VVKCGEGKDGYRKRGHHWLHISRQNCSALPSEDQNLPLFGAVGNRVLELVTGASLTTTSIREYENEGGNTQSCHLCKKHVQLVQGEGDSEMRQLWYLFSEEEVKAKRAHKFNSASSEQFLLVWTTAMDTPHTHFPHVAGPGRTAIIGI